MEPHSLLTLQKRAADRSAHCHFLACQRAAQGCLGTALFYQFEAARMHQRACELREQYEREQTSDVVTDPRSGNRYRITRYLSPRNSDDIRIIHGMMKKPRPERFCELLD